jgi:hypothetical protein
MIVLDVKGLLSLAKAQAERPPFDGCQPLLIQRIRSYYT